MTDVEVPLRRAAPTRRDPQENRGLRVDVQSLATATLLIPTVIAGVIAWQAHRAGRTRFGLGLRAGAIGEFVRGIAWGAITAGVFLLVFVSTGIVTVDGYTGGWVGWAGIAAYFLVLFVVEEIAFRGVLLTGLGVLAGPALAVIVTSVLVALPYSFSPGTSILAVLGAVVTNAVNGVARLRTGRIWWGLGWRWLLNIAFVGLGFSDAGFRLDTPVIAQHVTSPAWISGGDFGPEAGIIGIAIELAAIGLILTRLTGRTGPWTVAPRPTRA